LLVAKEGQAAFVLHREYVLASALSSDIKKGTYDFTFGAKSIRDDMALIWIGAASCWVETGPSTMCAADVCWRGSLWFQRVLIITMLV